MITTDLHADPEVTGTTGAAAPARLTFALLAIIAVSIAAIAVAGGYFWGSSARTPSLPSTTSVDAGFARDMSTHHAQAVTMAGYERDNTSNQNLKLLAFDIETSQQFQIGEMQGWLDVWGLNRSTDAAPMSWMAGHGHVGADGLMPGMATAAQMNELESSHGPALDLLFLQLMIHHHQGGIPMAQYAVEHATEPSVRTLAAAMVAAQTNEIISMEQTLRQLGGAPLPPPVQ